MKPRYKKSLFIFRRDLRLNDNTGLKHALKESAAVIPCFILDPRQVGSTNTYKSQSALQFMIESLVDLQKQLAPATLLVAYGKTDTVIKTLLKNNDIEAVFFNKDYTPFSMQRDSAIEATCQHNSCACISWSDELLTEPGTVLNSQKKPYSIFTPFFRKAQDFPLTLPTATPKKTFCKATTKGLRIVNVAREFTAQGTILKKKLPNQAVRGGRTAGLALLKKLPSFKDYAKTRDIPHIATTHLSAHNKFGTLSIREVAHAIIQKLGPGHPLLRQLYWRDFYTHIVYNFPYVLGAPFKKKYAQLVWNTNKTFFNAWQKGQTGFPIVDAGMRQLNETGFMHNRVRMIVASFLVKDLHIDWQKGERYFAQHLLDYDPAVNNGNWQWCASTGSDAQPYFRIFNPWLQQKKFDPECIYIKTWVPELQKAGIRDIHTAYKTTLQGYPSPIVDHTIEAKRARNAYKKII